MHHAFDYWADVFRAQSQGVGDSTTSQNYLSYLRQSLRENKPWDKMASELVTGSGACFDNGAIGCYMWDRGMPLDNFSNTTRIFLGTRMECAQCHDHPFDKWTQKQFYEMGAFTQNMTASSYRSPVVEETQKMIRQDKSLDKDMQDLMRQAVTEVTRPLRDKRDLDNRRQLAGLLDQTEASLLFEAFEQVAAAMKEQNKEFDTLRKELDEARAKNDKEKSKDIQRRLGES